MLAHKCDGLGTFATAFRKDNVSAPRLTPPWNWEKKFEFLEKCEFEVNNIVEESYIVKDSQKYENRSVRYTSKQIRFGTYKGKKRMPEDHHISTEDIQAHKFKYGWSDPIRENEFVGEKFNNYERIKAWGRYIAPPDVMYDNFNNATTHIYDISLKKYEMEDLPSGQEMTRDEFENAEVDVTVEQMVIECRDISFMTPRVNVVQKFDYTVGGKPVVPKPRLVLQTKIYELDNAYYELQKDNGQDCVHKIECLADVDIYKYKNESLGK